MELQYIDRNENDIFTTTAYAADDDWDSHVYILNREKFLAYFQLKKEG